MPPQPKSFYFLFFSHGEATQMAPVHNRCQHIVSGQACCATATATWVIVQLITATSARILKKQRHFGYQNILIHPKITTAAKKNKHNQLYQFLTGEGFDAFQNLKLHISK